MSRECKVLCLRSNAATVRKKKERIKHEHTWFHLNDKQQSIIEEACFVSNKTKLPLYVARYL